ncbi:MAG: 30S ribosomal protein S6 [bacterium]|nr:30S ribosomal protein S6 [bacterium]
MAKKGAVEREDAEIEDSSEARVGETRVYELGFHLDPELSSEVVKSAYQDIRSLIAGKGEVVAEGEPEKIALAYTISRQGPSNAPGRRDFDSAYFCWIAYEAPVEAHEEIVRAVGAQMRIIRFIDLATDKEAARDALQRAELAGLTSEGGSEVADASSDDALDAALLGAAA